MTAVHALEDRRGRWATRRRRPAPGAMGETRLRSTVRGHVRVVIAVAVAAGALAAVSATVASPGGSYRLSAVFAQAPGLFPGAAVDVLGVPVGTVTSVNEGIGGVVVGMEVSRSVRLPVHVHAALVAPQLLGEPNVQLSPGFSGGPHLASGARIPEGHTSVPVSTSQLLKDLERRLRQLDPHAVGDLVTNLAQDLSGQGEALNNLIHGAAGTLALLARNGNTLGQLEGSLAAITGTLRARTAQISDLIVNYDTVSQVLASHGAQLGQAVTQLASASTQLAQLLSPNLAPLEQDVGTITTAGRTLDRNVANVDELLASAEALFSAAQHAYDPSHNWINLNNQLPPGVTGAYVAGLVRDRLAGVCRRILAHHATGLSASQLQTLQTCGNPSSGFFDPIMGVIPTVLDGLAGAAASPPSTPAQASPPPGSAAPPPTAQSMLNQGLAEIPGLAAGAGAPPANPAQASAPGAPGQGGSPGASTGGGGLVGGLVGGLQAHDTSAVTSPSLTAPAALFLGPMPHLGAGGASAGSRPSARGFLGGIAHALRVAAHAIWSWL